MNRREFVGKAGVGGLGLAILTSVEKSAAFSSAILLKSGERTNAIATRELLKKAVLRKKDVDRFIAADPPSPEWAFFDSDLGYRIRNSIVKDGMDGALTFTNFAPTGERRMVNWNDRRCRINTYGDSFTQCQQVSDGETWQEILAAHIGEPIRNFGIGGYGVYQAYRRMLREEGTASSAPYIIFNIWDDDHFRSIMRWRWIVCGGWRDRIRENDGKTLKEISSGMLHANPWVHIRFDPKSGDVKELPNPYPTRESLYDLCDEEKVYEEFKDDLVVQLTVGEQNGIFDFPEEIAELRRTFGIAGDMNRPDECRRVARELYWECALRASQYVLGKTALFADSGGKKIMVLLSYGQGNVIKACKGIPRFDRSFLDFLDKNKIPYIDTLAAHVKDYGDFRITPEEYAGRYYVGHYSPRGNHFFAHAIKDAVVRWLEPKPPAYEWMS